MHTNASKSTLLHLKKVLPMIKDSLQDDIAIAPVLSKQPVAQDQIAQNAAVPPALPPSSFLSAAALSSLGAALLAACGGGGSDGGATSGAPTAGVPATAPNGLPTSTPSSGTSGTTTPSGNPAATGFNNFPQAQTNEDASRYLLQSQFSASDAEIAALKGTTYAAYLRQEFDKPLSITGWDWLNARGYGVSDTYGYYNYTYPTDFMLWNQLYAAPDAMRKRVALALSEFFVV
jgi:hypothetical protein